MNETATTIDAAAPALPRLRHVAAELDRRLFVAGVAACTAARRGVPPRPAVGLAAARGRDTAAVRRPATDRRPLRHRPRQARRGPVALPARLGGGARGRRPRDHALLLRAVRGREHPGDRRTRQPAGRSRACTGRLRARGGELDPPLPRHLRPHVQPLPASSRRSRTSPCSARPNEAGTRAWTALGHRHAAHHRVAPVRRARARLAGPLRPGHPQPAPPGRRRLRCRAPPRRPALAQQRRARQSSGRRCGRRRRQAAHASGGVRVPLARRRRRLDRLRRRPRDRARVRGVRPRLAGAETAAQRAPDRAAS